MKKQIYARYRLEKRAFEIREDAELCGFLDRRIEDMVGLTKEILKELGVLSPIFVVYLIMLDQEQYRFDLLEAYQAGREGRSQNQTFEQCVANFIRREELEEETGLFYSRFCRYHTYLTRRLGEKKGLLQELLEEYREVYGAVNRSIAVFIRMGYNSIK